MQKTTDFGLVVLCVYEYSDIKIVERVERFSSETTTYWLRVPHFDFEAITEKYNDTNVVFVKSFAASVEQVRYTSKGWQLRISERCW